MIDTLYMVVRTDMHGTQVLMKDACTKTESEEICARFQARGHRQTYRSIPYTQGRRSQVMAALGVHP